MEGSELARALVKRRWDAVDARQRVRGKWTGANNPNAAKTLEEKRARDKRLIEPWPRKLGGTHKPLDYSRLGNGSRHKREAYSSG